MDRHEAIKIAREFLATSDCHVDELGHVMFHFIADQDALTDKMWANYLREHPGRTDALDCKTRSEIDAIKQRHREHWTVAFHIHDPAGVATSPSGPIVNVYPDGSADFFDVL